MTEQLPMSVIGLIQDLSRGDLLIYSKKFQGTGHVAMIVGVQSNRVQIAEQNYLDAKWPNPNYVRELLMTRDLKGNYAVPDEKISGWIRSARSF